jgi:hypothetical protein
MRDIRFEQVTFASSEAEEITGISQTQQRNLRRAGYLKETPYPPASLAKMLIMGKLDRLNIPPAFSSGIADHKVTKAIDSAAVLVLIHAQLNPSAIYDPDDRARGEKPIKVSPAAPAARFLIVSGDEMDFEKSLSKIQGDENDSPAVIVLDLRAMGSELVRRAGQPLWRVETD